MRGPHTIIYVSSYYYMCPDTTIYVSTYYYIYVLILLCMCPHTLEPQQRQASIRQHASAYVSIRQHASAYVSIRHHTSAYVSIRQHTSPYVSISEEVKARKAAHTCVHSPRYVCPHTASIRVLIPPIHVFTRLYICPHTAYMCPHTACIYMSSCPIVSPTSSRSLTESRHPPPPPPPPAIDACPPPIDSWPPPFKPSARMPCTEDTRSK